MIELWPGNVQTKLYDSPALSLPTGMLTVVDCPLIEVASRDLRKRVAEGRSIRFLVPRAVEEYVREKKLYRE